MSDALRQSIEAAARRLALVVGRGRIKQSDDSGPIQSLQVSLNSLETPDLRRVSEFGHASWPPDGCDAIVLFIGGDRSNGVVIGTHDLSSRFKLETKGESALYDIFGKYIWLKKESVEIECNDKPLLVKNTKKLTIEAGSDGMEITVTGNVVLNMGGNDLVINDPGAVNLTGAGGRKVACDGDSVVAGVIVADPAQKVTAT